MNAMLISAVTLVLGILWARRCRVWWYHQVKAAFELNLILLLLFLMWQP